MVRGQRIARVLHFIGLALFLGSIFGHIALQAIPGSTGESETILFLRTATVVTTRLLTVPGLVLLVITGVWMTVRSHGGFFRHRWLTLHQTIAGLILLNAFLILRPLGLQLLAAAQELQGGALDLSTFQHLARREMMFGPVNLVLTLATMAVAVFRPSLRRGPSQ